MSLTARLAGAQEVPRADRDGNGKATVNINVEAGRVCFELNGLRDTSAPHGGYIDHTPAGSNGPIVVPFLELA